MKVEDAHARAHGLLAMLTLAVTSAMLALVASSATAMAAGVPASAHAASNAVKPDATPASHTIAGAEELTLGDEQSGGGGPVDFWLIDLTGGDQVQFSVQAPGAPYDFNLFAPGTTDVEFPTATPVDIAYTTIEGQDDITLQAPYTGTFILAVCEDSGNNDCSNTASGSGNNPMNPYTFTPQLAGNPCGTSPAGEVRAGSTIAAAGQFSVGRCQAGGGDHVDFWRVKLTGGDQVQFSVQAPGAPYDFNLYAPGTTDVEFPTATPVDIANTNTVGQDDITLQAPYTGTFVLAVCEDSGNNDCSNTATGSGNNPMSPYTFTPQLAGNPCGTRPIGEIQAGRTIAAARQFSVGRCQAGGGDHVDIWRVKLTRSDRVQFSVQAPGAPYDFNLYAPGTTDVEFPTATPVDIAYTNTVGQQDITLQAPYTGTFVLAVCEDSGNNDCSNTATGSGNNPMNPYTFTPRLVGGRETTASLKLSTSRLAYGNEKVLKLSVTVKAQFSKSHPTGSVTIRVGKKTICRIKLSAGRGTCSPSSRTLLRVGTYHLVATYGGSKSFSASASKPATLKVTKARKRAA